MKTMNCWGIVAVTLWGVLAANAVEKNYDFRSRLGVLHPPRRAGDAAPVKANETAVDAAWRIVTLSDDPVIRHAAADLADYFAKSMGETVRDEGRGVRDEKGGKLIVLSVDPGLPKLQAKVEVTADAIRITGGTARETAQGCYRIEDVMNFRGLPAVERGVRTYTRMFSPRMVHSGWELDKFPDVYLDHLAHMGMDAVLVYVTESPDVTRNGREDMPDIVRRAGERGLDVYVYAHQIAAASHMHPDDPDAAEFCDRLWGSIVKNAPGLKGMVFVGESIAFTSKDPTIGGFWWKYDPSTAHTNGFWPTLEWVPWLERVRDATRKYNPDFDIVFWTYNWSSTPEKGRLALLEKVPTNITVHVTFEMGDKRPERNGVNDDVDDYSILHPGPSKMFQGEAEVVSRRGIRLTSMSNTGGRTWDCGAAPFVPVPERWIDRHRALREAHRRWNLVGLMESHHYGFQPNFIAEIAKASFTEESDEMSVLETLRGIAARDFGCQNVDTVLAAWHDWSEAFLFHSARYFDQGGPLRIGPTFALVLPGDPWPLPPYPQYEYYEGLRHGNGWKYLGDSYRMPQDQIEGRLKTTENELALWRKGNVRLERALATVPLVKFPYAERMLGLGRFYEHTVRTVRNCILFKREALVMRDGNVLEQVRKQAAKKLFEIIDDEEKNVRETIPVVEADSSLGWEPSMFYIADREHLEWKLRQLDDARRSVAAEEGFVEIFNGHDLNGWEGATNTYCVTEEGFLTCTQEGGQGGSGAKNLWTIRDYTNFVIRFDVKLPPNANNGLGIRCKPNGLCSREGMELQLLDDWGDAYNGLNKLADAQYTGSVYGIVPPARKVNGESYLNRPNEWNSVEVTADGHHIAFVLNGTKIVDTDVSKFSTDGTVPADGIKRPGLHNLSGRIHWCGHGHNIFWRNIRIKELP